MTDFRPMADRWCRVPTEGGDCRRDKGHDGDHSVTRQNADEDATLREPATPTAIEEAMDLVKADNLPAEDRAALYAFLYELQRRINRSLGIRQKGRTAQYELTEYMTANGLNDLGPLYIGWEAFDVRYECNAADKWSDPDVQQAMAAIRSDPALRGYIRQVPAHLEVDAMALGSDVHAGSDKALTLYKELKAKGWRTEGGKRAALKVREVKAPKKEAA